MPQDQKTHDDEARAETPFNAAAKGKPAGAEDLSARVAAAVKREPGDTVRCTRVGEDRYRCNWWAAQATSAYDNPGMYGLLVTTHRVRKSLFLRATQTSAGLTLRIDESCSTKGLTADDLRLLPGDATILRA